MPRSLPQDSRLACSLAARCFDYRQSLLMPSAEGSSVPWPSAAQLAARSMSVPKGPDSGGASISLRNEVNAK